jgi:hypothetical protein
MADSPKPPRSTFGDRFLLVSTLGIAAGCIGSLASGVLADDSLPSYAMVVVIFTFVPALLASRYTASPLLVLWVELGFGTAMGALLSVFLHPLANTGGERNLWLFEIIIFWGVGILPTCGGLYLGRKFRSRRMSG